MQPQPRSFLTRCWDRFLPAPTLHLAARGAMALAQVLGHNALFCALDPLFRAGFLSRKSYDENLERFPRSPPLQLSFRFLWGRGLSDVPCTGVWSLCDHSDQSYSPPFGGQTPSSHAGAFPFPCPHCSPSC